MHQTLLIVGHSHVECLRPAAAEAGGPAITILDLQLHRKERPAALLDRVREAPPAAPDALCLCLSGNVHNAFGILEHPEPYAIGDAEAGAVPGDPGRRLVPYHLMLDEFRHQYRGARALAERICAVFPAARRLVLNAPPPLGDWTHIRAHPGVFARRLAQGPGPHALRRKLFEIQTAVLREMADALGATFVDPAPLAAASTGFLERRYYSIDPTHGNAAYGALALERVLASLGNPT